MDATADVQWHCNHLPPLWYHYFPDQSSLDVDILVYWTGKIVRTCAPGGSRTLDSLRARRAPCPLGQALRYYLIVKLDCFICRTITVIILGVPIFIILTVLSGEAILPVSFLLPFPTNVHPKKISSSARFSPLTQNLFLKGFLCLGKQTGIHRSCFPLKQVGKKWQLVFTLKLSQVYQAAL